MVIFFSTGPIAACGFALGSYDETLDK